MDFVCPRCQHRYQSSENLVGKEVRCKNAACGHVFRVVAARESPIASPPTTAVPPGPKSGVAPPASGAAASGPRIPAGMPPMPARDGSPGPTGDALGFLSGSAPPAIDGRTPASREAAVSEGEPAIGVKRPFGVVWIVFYWLFSGVLAAVGGLFLTSLLSFAAGAAGALRDLPFESRSGTAAALMSLVMELIGLLIFHLGLLTLVACYGLWTFRKWGLSLAKIVAFVNAALNLIGLVICLVTRVGIVASLGNSFVSVAILVYLYGGGNLSARLQRYSTGLHGVEDTAWKYE